MWRVYINNKSRLNRLLLLSPMLFNLLQCSKQLSCSLCLSSIRIITENSPIELISTIITLGFTTK